MDLKKLLKRAILSQKDPDTYKELTNAEIATLIAQLVQTLGSHKKELVASIEERRAKNDKEVIAVMDELKTKYRDTDLEQLAGLRKMVEQSVAEAQTAKQVIEQIGNELRAKAATLKDGKDGVVTNKEIKKAASMVMSQIPSMKSILKSDPTYLRDILEELAEDDRLEMSAIKGSEVILAKVDKMEDRVKRMMTPGAIIAQRLDQIGDVDLTTTPPTDGQVISWDATNKKWAPSSGGSGDTTGPASSTDNAITRFNGTTGKTLQNSGVTISDTDAIDGVASLDIDASGSLTVADTAILSDSAGTMTLSNVDALDATTATTIATGADAATATTTGVVELATTAETTTGTDATRAVTPDGLKDGYQGSANVTTLGTVTTGNVDAAVTDASLTAKGKVELATVAETDTGTDATRAVTPDGLQGSLRNLRFVDFVVVEPATDVATGTGKATWSAPFAGTIVQDDSNPDYFAAYTTTAGTTGTMVVDIHKGGTTIMTTNKLDIETTELDTTTAATQPDLTTTTFSAGDVFTIDIDAVHTTAAKGLLVRMAVRPD